MKDNIYNVPISKVIWVFSTSVTSQSDIRRLKPILDKLMHEGDKWNFDLEDCDHILRVETRMLKATTIMDQLNKCGYECVELEDNSSFNITPFIPDFAMN